MKQGIGSWGGNVIAHTMRIPLAPRKRNNEKKVLFRVSKWIKFNVFLGRFQFRLDKQLKVVFDILNP